MELCDDAGHSGTGKAKELGQSPKCETSVVTVAITVYDRSKGKKKKKGNIDCYNC